MQLPFVWHLKEPDITLRTIQLLINKGHHDTYPFKKKIIIHKNLEIVFPKFIMCPSKQIFLNPACQEV